MFVVNVSFLDQSITLSVTKWIARLIGSRQVPRQTAANHSQIRSQGLTHTHTMTDSRGTADHSKLDRQQTTRDKHLPGDETNTHSINTVSRTKRHQNTCIINCILWRCAAGLNQSLIGTQPRPIMSHVTKTNIANKQYPLQDDNTFMFFLIRVHE